MFEKIHAFFAGIVATVGAAFNNLVGHAHDLIQAPLRTVSGVVTVVHDFVTGVVTHIVALFQKN